MLRILCRNKNVVQFIDKASFCNKANSDYVPVYIFPLIKTFSIVNRIKYYQTAATAVAVPLSFVLNQACVLSFDNALATATVGLSGCLVLHTFGFFTKNFVGIIYINEKKGEVKVSHLDFWGKRKDDIIGISDIVPFSDLPTSFTDSLFTKLRRFSDEKFVLRVPMKHGKVIDEKLFNKHIQQNV